MAHGSAPFLLPATSHIAAAVRAPALQTVHTTPRAIVVDLDFPFRRMHVEKLAVVR